MAFATARSKCAYERLLLLPAPKERQERQRCAAQHIGGRFRNLSCELHWNWSGNHAPAGTCRKALPIDRLHMDSNPNLAQVQRAAEITLEVGEFCPRCQIEDHLQFFANVDSIGHTALVCPINREVAG